MNCETFERRNHKGRILTFIIVLLNSKAKKLKNSSGQRDNPLNHVHLVFTFSPISLYFSQFFLRDGDILGLVSQF